MKFLNSVAKRAVVVFLIQLVFVGKGEVFFLQPSLLEECGLLVVTPFLEVGTDNAYIIFISLVIQLYEVGIGIVFMVSCPGCNVVLEERFAEIWFLNIFLKNFIWCDRNQEFDVSLLA